MRERCIKSLVFRYTYLRHGRPDLQGTLCQFACVGVAYSATKAAYLNYTMTAPPNLLFSEVQGMRVRVRVHVRTLVTCASGQNK